MEHVFAARERPARADARPRAAEAVARAVPERLYRKHLCVPDTAALEPETARLVEASRLHYAERGEPWSALAWHPVRRVGAAEVELANGRTLHSAVLAGGCARTDVVALAVLGASAGTAVDREVERLWQEERPDASVFLSAFAASVVEHLRACREEEVCAGARARGLTALPRYAPGYDGWDLCEQPTLLALLAQPGPLRVLPSGGLEPARSALAVVCLARRPPAGEGRAFWESPRSSREEATAPGAARYSFSAKALARWATERLAVVRGADGRVRASFRFDGTTCMNLGTPLAFRYVVDLQSDGARLEILRGECTPAPGDEGHRAMCLCESDASALRRVLAEEAPFVGRSLGDALAWDPERSPAACLCTRASRAHKWKMVLETLHYALAGEGRIALGQHDETTT